MSCASGAVCPGHAALSRGFTLVEVIATAAIVMTVAALAIPGYANALESARIVRAVADVRAMSDEIMAYRIDTGDVPDSLAELGRDGHRDPWGNPYVYLKFGAGGGNDGAKGARKDKWLTPLNSFYDLYSKGPDGETQLPLTARSSWDDIIVAGDGLFVGVAEDF